MRESLRAIRHLERVVLDTAGVTGVVLRYGSLYGPGTSLSKEYVEMARKRKLPIVGDGGGIWSFVHVDDAAAATVAAVERGDSGIYNIVDDDPAPVAEWLPVLARHSGGKPPRRVPAWLGRLATGEVGVSMMTRIRGSSNEKAKRELGWQPGHPTWRDGLGLDGAEPPALLAPRAQPAAERPEAHPDHRVDQDQEQREAAEGDLLVGAGERVGDEEAGGEEGAADDAPPGAAPRVLVLEAGENAAHGRERQEPPVEAGGDAKRDADQSSEREGDDSGEDDLSLSRPVAQQSRRLHRPTVTPKAAKNSISGYGGFTQSCDAGPQAKRRRAV